MPIRSIPFRGYEAIQFCNNFSEKEGLKPFYQVNGETVAVLSWSRDGYRLPTEAEWEYASAGDPGELGTSAWYDQNAGGVAHPVGGKGANRFGIHDMLGNVYEWCWDSHDSGYYRASPPDTTRAGPPWSHRHRVIRGGSWGSNPRRCRSAYRLRRLSRRSGSATWASVWPGGQSHR